MLERLLAYAAPKTDASALGRGLLGHFGNIKGLLEADAGELENFGLSQRSAQLLALIPQLYRYMQKEQAWQLERVESEEEWLLWCQGLFAGLKYEQTYMMALNKDRAVLCVEKLAEGEFGRAALPIRDIVSCAIKRDAASVVLLHNHPSGKVDPSPEDVHATRQVKQVLGDIGIRLLAHIVYARGQISLIPL